MAPGGEALESKGRFIKWYLRDFSGIRLIYFKVNHARKRVGEKENIASAVLSNLHVCKRFSAQWPYIPHGSANRTAAVWRLALGFSVSKFSIFDAGQTVGCISKGCEFLVPRHLAPMW